VDVNEAKCWPVPSYTHLGSMRKKNSSTKRKGSSTGAEESSTDGKNAWPPRVVGPLQMREPDWQPCDRNVGKRGVGEKMLEG